MWTSVGGRRGRPLTGNQGAAQQNTIVDFGVGPTLRWCPLSVFNDGAARCNPGLSSSILLCGRRVNDNANRHNVSFIAWPAALRTAGAGRPITVAATHRLLLPGAHDKLGAAGIDPLYLTDSVPVADRIMARRAYRIACPAAGPGDRAAQRGRHAIGIWWG